MADHKFLSAAIEPGLLFESTLGERVLAWRGSAVLPPGATHFGIVTEGECVLRRAFLPQVGLSTGMFFAASERVDLHGSAGIVISVADYAGLFQVGGPIEATGRLQYIDGCSDTLLVSPPRKGDPCLNHLHVPPHTRQTEHTHPSVRIGVILRGEGECRTPTGIHRLTPGMAWAIPAGSRHAFVTHDDSLDVVAWHPDSDFGPTDDVHPMINRTMLG